MNSLVSGTDLLTIASQITSGSPFTVLDSKSPSSRKDCCSQDRLIRSLTLLPQSEVDDILKVGENVEAKCEFCGTQYKLTPEEVVEEIAKAKEANEKVKEGKE
jgi:molecular chaperone Hsp33